MTVLILFALVVVALPVTITIVSRVRETARNQRTREAMARERRMEECRREVGVLRERYGYMVHAALKPEAIDRLIECEDTDAPWIRRFILRKADEAEGLVLGVQRIGEDPAYVKLPPELRTKHVYIIGRSGAGKTNLIRNMILQDLEAGHGLAVLAPEQELIVEEVLPFIPKHRIDDIVYINPADIECPVSFNPLHYEEGENVDLKTDEMIDIFRQLFSDIGAGSAPRLEAILQHAIRTLLLIPEATLEDMERLLSRTDPSYRRWAVELLGDQRLRSFWLDRYEAFPKDAHHSVLNRLDRLLHSKEMRAALCTQAKPFSFREAMDTGQVVLINLSDGILGVGNASLLGQIIVAKIQAAVMSRADIPKAARRPFHVYMDEFQTFCGVAAKSYERMLERARKYRLGMVLAHQQSGQIPDSLMQEILGCVSTIIAFQIGAKDAGRIAREMIVAGRPLEATVLQTLRVGSAYGKIDRTVFRMETRLAPDVGDNAIRDEVIRRSRERFRPASKMRFETTGPVNERGVKETAGGEFREATRQKDRLKELDPGEVF